MQPTPLSASPPATSCTRSPTPLTHATNNIAWLSKVWSEADRKRALFYLEADTLLWGLAKCRFWALSSPFPLYAFSDHLPLNWVRKCEKGPVSEFTIEQLSDVSCIPSYLPGPEDSLFDALSRYPLLGPRVLAPGRSIRRSLYVLRLSPSLSQRRQGHLRFHTTPHPKSRPTTTSLAPSHEPH